MNISSLGRFELASRIALDETTGSWFVVGIEDEQRASLLAEDIESLVDYEIAIVQVADRELLVAASREHASRLVLLHATEGLESLHLDDVRSLLQRDHAAVLAVLPAELAHLASIAPHFASWAGNRVFLVEDDRFLDEEAREKRLEALRTHYGMSDEQFLAEVEFAELALEPDHAEWLVLLDRSDLLEARR
ncbi:hypothetical protein [Paraliomyxa miuraensis]|uniref:hypothetical protein n=1 Tax=Paraliomyxa miuraensis TaxID=376150 RepID=UPI00224D75EF|nr:hypothetical protein [Paraliomyxa miuraensis]MCX4242101.1 hypothetical protein [Paraliomyxa miuraensis]